MECSSPGPIVSMSSQLAIPQSGCTPALPGLSFNSRIHLVLGVWRWISFATALLEPVTVAVHLQDVDVMGDAVEQSAGEAFGAEDLGPFLERQVAGDQR